MQETRCEFIDHQFRVLCEHLKVSFRERLAIFGLDQPRWDSMVRSNNPTFESLVKMLKVSRCRIKISEKGKVAILSWGVIIPQQVYEEE